MATHHLKDLSLTKGEAATQEHGDTFRNPVSSHLVWALIFLAWASIFLLEVTGQDHLLHYEVLFESNSPPLLIKLIVFLLAWQVMIVAMMLPTSLPLIRLFTNVSSEAGSTLVLPVFLSAYFAIWTSFALLTFLGDLGLHLLLSYLPWRSHYAWLISGTVLLLAGAFQFSELKNHCLKACRHPLSFLTHHYRRGLKAAWNLGINHGLYCLGCCWALMLVMFAVGISHLTWMIVLTGVMAVEKTARWGRILVPLVGGGLIVWGMITLLHPVFTQM
ncbi:MAG: DUF2182 domain-containing protein [Chroococcidiopsidaceae cyanobacterium CP_BM_ER_R8_30]|nr:DUF2182 domain-containing protein [Chroococcidiopsidaceae cyanobacterium CP_BM_ER_R8_30]